MRSRSSSREGGAERASATVTAAAPGAVVISACDGMDIDATVGGNVAPADEGDDDERAVVGGGAVTDVAELVIARSTFFGFCCTCGTGVFSMPSAAVM